MDLKSLLMLLRVIAIFVWCIAVGTTANCAVIPTDKCVINQSITFDTGIYNFNGSSGGGAIVINTGGNVTLNCNNSVIIGNNTADTFTARGLSVEGRNNVTIINCTFKNYYRGIVIYNSQDIKLENTNVNDTRTGVYIVSDNTGSSGKTERITLKNMNLYNSSYRVIDITGTSGNITNNVTLDSLSINSDRLLTISGGGIIRAEKSANLLFSYINFTDTLGNSSKIQLSGITNITMLDSNFINFGPVIFENGFNMNFINNTHFNNTQSIHNTADGSTQYSVIVKNYTNSNIIHNVFNKTDLGLKISNINTNILIDKNVFQNTNSHEDIMDTALYIEDDRTDASNRATNFTVTNNLFYDFGCIAVQIRGANNGNISKNNFSISKPAAPATYDCNGEPFMAIGILEYYIGFIPVTSPHPINYSIVSPHYSNNISVSDNNYGNVDVILRTQGVVGLTHDLSSYWLSSFQSPEIADIDNLYINILYNNLTILDEISSVYPRNNTKGLYTTNLRYGDYFNWTWNWSIDKNTFTFKNVNVDNLFHNFSVYFKTNALAFNQSLSLCSGFSSNINSNDGNINTTLQPNEACTILDNYNLTEGYNRTNSPIWFSSNTTSEKHIASNLIDPTNISVTFIVESCDNIEKINYVSDTGTYTRQFTEGEYMCSNGIVTLDGIVVEKASSSGVITIAYQYDSNLYQICTGLSAGFSQLGDMITILVLVIVAVVVLGMYNIGVMDFKGLIVSSMITLAITAMINIFAVIFIQELC